MSETDDEIHVKRISGSRFVSNYSPVLLKVWEGNLDIQSEHNYHKALTCMTAYFWKSESEVSDSLKQGTRKIKNLNLNLRATITTYLFICTGQLSVQETF